MGWKSFDYVCPHCSAQKIGEIVDDEEECEVLCDACNNPMERKHPAPRTFSTIVPTYTGSAKYKAGYVHKHVNRPAEKTQMGYGGGVSQAHPTGSTKNTQ